MSAPASTTARATKKSAFSCEPCRRRKVKCGGEQPVCGRCLARNDVCLYKLNPTLSYTQRLEERVKELEAQLARGSSHSPPHSYAQADGLPSSSSTTFNSNQDGSHPGSESGESLAGTFRGLKLDDKGVVTYHGDTSFFHLPSEWAASTMRDTPSPSNSEDPVHGKRERLVSNAWQQRALEDLSAIPEPFQYLINTHWCWIQPLFNFLYRPAFTRDMQLLGPYYSHTLLNAVLSHSVRWGRSDKSTREHLSRDYDGGAVFGRHARTMVFDELSRGVATIPTVQTLLLLSAQECSQGNTAQAWMYSGMAFRMIDHLGICVDSQRYTGSVAFSDEDIEIRRRLFWSCYFWDKIVSLYLGRSPSLQHSNVSPPQMMLDDSNENEMWSPFGLTYPEGVRYPPTAAHSSSCFTRMCQLSVIFNQILIHMYDPLQQNTEAKMRDCLVRQDTALKQWWEELPPFLKLEATMLPPLAPPSHIVTLNVLYHTFNILLHRPMLSRSKLNIGNQPQQHSRAKHLLECVSSATAIIAIFDLFCKSFGIYRCVLSLSYSVYIAASIFLLQVQAAPANEEQALRRLDFCIRALERLKTINPIVGSALGLIVRELAALGIRSNAVLGGGYGAAVRGRTSSMASGFGGGNQQSQRMSSFHENMVGVEFGQFGNRPQTGQPNSGVGAGLFQFPKFENLNNPNAAMGHGISDEVFEAVSSLEPISAAFGVVGENSGEGSGGMNFGA